MKKACIYYRVSTDKQDLSSQRVAIKAWLQDKDYKITEVFRDEGYSGKDTKRPAFNKMMRAAKQGEFDTIICYRLDRFSRDATTAIKTILELDEIGVAFISVSQPVLNLGHENPFRRTMLSAFAEIAQIERETIVARVKSGLEAAKSRGQKLGAPIRFSQEEVGKALRLRSEGKTYKQIAEILGFSVGRVFQKLAGLPSSRHCSS